jgi:hypothetical protein
VTIGGNGHSREYITMAVVDDAIQKRHVMSLVEDNFGDTRRARDHRGSVELADDK